VLSPITGIVSLRHVQNGQIISSGISNIGGGTTLLTLSDLSRIFTVASVDEADIGMIRVGQDVLVTVDAHPDEKLLGKVVLVATRGVNVSNVVTFDVKIEIMDEKKHLLKPEMTTNVQVNVKKSVDVAMVPSESLKQVEEGYAVEVLRGDGLIEERKVTVGINDGFFAEIKSGVEKDEKVIMQRSEESSRWKSSEKRKTFPPPPPNI
jgi:HlyD family secretion protein